MIVINRNLVLSAVTRAEAYLPVIGYRSELTIDNLAADSATDDEPVTNLANPSTSLRWQSASTQDQYVTVTFSSVTYVDYVGIAGHNFGTARIAASVGYFDETETWVELSDEVMPADDRPLLFRFSKTAPAALKIRMRAGIAPPRIAVLYAGEILTMELGIQVGFTPLTLGRQVKAVNGRGESGSYLGRIRTMRSAVSSPSFTMLSPDWYRQHFDPFLEEALEDTPFFFAWAPRDWPLEVGFAWLADGSNPMPSIHQVTGRLQITLELEGLA